MNSFTKCSWHLWNYPHQIELCERISHFPRLTTDEFSWNDNVHQAFEVRHVANILIGFSPFNRYQHPWMQRKIDRWINKSVIRQFRVKTIGFVSIRFCVDAEWSRPMKMRMRLCSVPRVVNKVKTLHAFFAQVSLYRLISVGVIAPVILNKLRSNAFIQIDVIPPDYELISFVCGAEHASSTTRA